MLIWILAIVLLALGGAIGYFIGAIRILTVTVGLFAGVLFAAPLGRLLRPLFEFATSHVLWLWILPVLTAFLIIVALFVGLSFFLHRKADLHFKYRSGDYDYVRWDALNQRLGLPVGLLTGTVALFLAGWLIYVFGYLAVQLTTDSTESTSLRLLASAREDMRETGLDKPVAAIDWMPARYYQVSDVAGLIYHNPMVTGRLAQYPPYLLLDEAYEIQELAADPDFNNMFMSRADAMELLRHHQVRQVLSSPSLVEQILSPDFADLRIHLETGESPQFSEDPILGRWKLDPYATMAQERRRRPNIPAPELAILRKSLEAAASVLTLLATPDQRIIFKLETPQPAAAPDPSMEGTGIEDPYRDRYGVAPPTRAPQAPPQRQETQGPLSFSGSLPEGSWERDGVRYRLQLPNPLTGQTETVDAAADPERLIVQGPQQTMVFYRE